MCELIENMTPISGRNCLYASMASLMRYYGYSLGEAELFFLCSGFEYQYIISQEKELQKPSKKYIYRGMKEVGLYLQKFMRVDYLTGNGLMDEKDFKIVYQNIHNKNPSVIILNPAILQYTHRESQSDSEYELHCIILHGIDIREKKAYIIDSYVVNNSGIVSSFQGEISLDLVRAHTKGYLILQISTLEQINRIVIKETMCNALQKFLLSESINGNLTGWKALLKGIEKIGLLQYAKKEFRAVYCLELSYLLRAHFLFVFDYILEILNKYQFGMYPGLEEKIKQCRHAWSRYCMKIWKVSFDASKQSCNRLPDQGIVLIKELNQIIEGIIALLLKENMCNVRRMDGQI